MRLNSFHQKARLSAASAIDQLRNLLAKSAAGSVTQQLDLSELEDRILLSASPAAVMVESAPAAESVEVASPLAGESASLFEAATAGSSDETGESIDAAQPAALSNDAETSGEPDSAQLESAAQTNTPFEQAATEVVFVDDSVADFEQLIADLQAQRDAGRAVDFFVLDSQQDGIDQIAETLQRYSDLDAVHIVSHGSDGAVKLGGTWLRIGSLDGYAGTIAGWGSAFGADGDLLFYGCDLAASSRGELLVDSISALTGADVAASTDDTGSAIRGGDWEFEYDTGSIESNVIFTEQTQQEWAGKLAVINVTTTADVVDSGDGLISLREAIIQSNSGSGGDTISLSAGTYTFSIGGTGENNAATGDLDVTQDVTILGANQNLTVINANGIDRVFEVRDDANFTIQDLTVAGGSTSDDGAGVEARNAGSFTATRVIFTGNASGREGGAIHAKNDPVTLTDVALVGNSAVDSGGGIYAEGVTTLTRVTVSGNTAADGAGIYQTGASSDFTLVNVTISGNVAAGEGGGIWTDRPMSVTNSTIAFNTANAGAGFYISGGNGNLSLRNSILASNAQSDTQPDNVTTNNGGTLTSLGFNISSDGTAGLGGPGDQSNVDPLINPTLSLNGGTTETHALQSSSPAINTGTTTGAPTTDQRGVTRGANPDIGAYEAEATLLTPKSEFRVNTTTGNTQETSNEDRGSTQAVAIAPNGEYVVVWSSDQNTGGDGDGFGVLMQRFDAAGNTIGGELQVNQNTLGNQYYASVAMGDSGRGVVVWTDKDAGTNVKARLFNSDGTFNGNEFLANTTPDGTQDNAAVAMDGSGNFVVVWEGKGLGDIDGIHGQRFDAAGGLLGLEFRVNDTTSGIQGEPSVAMNSSGQFVVVWDDGSGVHARTYEADGTGGSGSQFNVDGGLSAGEADVGIDDAGRAVIVWRETNGLFGKGVYHRAFDFGGSALTSDGVVNSQVFGDQTNPSITMGGGGDYIVAWEGAGFTDSTGVMYQKYDSSFAKVGGETAINQTLTGIQSQVSLAMLDSDNFVVAWSGEGPGDSSGVFARQYGTAVPSNSDPTADAGGPYAISEGAALNLDSSASSDPDTDPLTFAWDLDNDGNFGETGEPTTETSTVSWATLVSFGITDDPGSPFTIGLQVDDGNGGVGTITTTLTVNNVAPTANPDSGAGFTTNEDSAFTTGSVLTNDTDANILDVLSVANLDSTATSGIVTDNGDGTFSYDPNGQFESLAQGQQTTDTFSYTVSDDDGGSSITTVTITLDGANDAPTDISLDNLAVNENVAGAVVGNLTTTDVDTGDTHSYVVDDTRFEVVGSQLKLKAGQSLDFEIEPTVSIGVTTTDQNTASFNKPFVVSVNDVNEAPSVSLSQSSSSLPEDADTSSAIVLATVSIADDALGSNSLALSGTDAARFEIDSGNLRLKAATPLDFETQTTYSVTVEVNDSLVGSNPDDSVNFTLMISDIDESPVVTTSAGVAAFTEDAGPVAIDSSLIVSDPEDAGFVVAEVRFDSGFVSGQDDLQFTNQSGISGSYDATSGVLTLSGSASVAAYETALRTVTYSNASQNPNTGNRRLRFTVNDGLNVDSATRTVTVSAVDDPANVVTGGPYAVAEGASVALDGSASNDVDNFIVEYTWDFDYDGMTFTTDATGSSTNFSAVGIDGPDTRTIALRTRSDNGVFAIATTTATISNVAPTANADSGTDFTTDEDSAFTTGNVVSNDTDPGPESLTVSSLDTTGTIGQVTDLGDGTFTYDPNGQFESLAPGQSANDTFSYTVTDGNASDTATVTVVISGANDAPNVTNQNVSVDENAALNTLVATAAATDIDTGDSVSWTIVSGNTNGAFSINSTSGEVRVAKPLEHDFESNPSYSLTVQADDENGGVDTGLITVSLNDLNEAPTANNAAFGIAEDSASGASVGVVSGSDPDTGDTLTWSILSGNASGAFSLNSATGELTVASPSTLDFETTPTYTLNVQIQDAGGLTDSAVVVVNVSNVNEAPTTTGLADVFVNEDSADVVVDLKSAFSDVETPSAALSYSIVGNSNSTLFSGTPIVGGNLILKFAADANGNAFITVRATDPQGLFVTTAFNVVVAPVADAPTSTADSYVVVGDQLTVPSAGGVLANDSDPDGDAISALLVSGPANGSLVLLSNGGFTYTPNDNFSGIDTFVYEPFDGTATGPQRTVVLNVNRVIAPPPPPADSGSSDSGESDDGDSAADTDSGESAEATIDAPPSAVDGSGQGSVVVESADGVTSQANESADDDAEEELTGVYTASESGGDFLSGPAQRLELRDATSVSVKTLNAVNSDGDSTDSDNRFRDSLRFDGEDLSYLVSTEFIQELEQVEDEFEFDRAVPEWATGTAVATTASISVGYIMWMLRGGYVLASVLSTMPVWQNIDPLPVLAALDAVDDEDDDSLETMIDRASDEADDSEGLSSDEADAERKDETV